MRKYLPNLNKVKQQISSGSDLNIEGVKILNKTLNLPIDKTLFSLFIKIQVYNFIKDQQICGSDKHKLLLSYKATAILVFKLKK